MSNRFTRTGALLLSAALLVLPSVAQAAGVRHKKGASKPDKARDKVEAEAPTPVASPEAAPEAPAEPQAKAETAAPAAAEVSPPAAEPRLAAPVPAAAAPEAGSAEGAPTAEEVELGRREARRIAAGRIAVAVSAGGGIANRRFTYSDAVGSNLADYRLPAAPMASFGIEAYPGASSGLVVLQDLGIRAHISRGFAFESDTPQGVTLETNWTRFGGELRQRLLLPGPHAFELGGAIGADASYFGMTAKARVPALLPAARTIALRFGVDARVLLAWRLSLLGGVGYLLTTSRGEVYEHFRRPKVRGVDADLGFAIKLEGGLELRLAGRYTRYFASFRPVIGDEFVAGGALDEQLQAGLGVRYAH